MHAAILHITFPPERHDDVVRFLRDEMLPVIRDNAGFVDFRVLDPNSPGELVMIDTWERREDSVRAIQRPAAVAVHRRYADLGLVLASASPCTVVAST